MSLNGRRLSLALEKRGSLMGQMVFVLLVLIFATGYIIAIKKK